MPHDLSFNLTPISISEKHCHGRLRKKINLLDGLAHEIEIFSRSLSSPGLELMQTPSAVVTA
ncbi:CLUMA_CG010274, isoform A [Clunio marinus]|uniref:CLUMA_CG010274, isoform A n=1 Tax=Clunio marinus TaxID=568069 RepID=A0A1J1IB40_9DIPT|nr:CLUMA_CG010274, isoform A [Clunio marinus]